MKAKQWWPAQMAAYASTPFSGNGVSTAYGFALLSGAHFCFYAQNKHSIDAIGIETATTQEVTGTCGVLISFKAFAIGISFIKEDGQCMP
jgi:hypothetical protein